MKKVISILLALVLMASLCSCALLRRVLEELPSEPEVSQSEAPEPEVTEPEVTEPEITEPEPEVTEQAPAPTPSGNLPDDLFSFQLELDGVIYQLPAPYSEFETNGWVGKEDLSTELDPDHITTSISLKNGEHEIYARFLNAGTDVLKLSECYVYIINLDSFDVDKGASLIFPSGITIGTKMDDVKSAYGDPSETYEGDYSINWTYKLKTYASAEIKFDPATKTVSDLKMENAFPAEGSEPAKGSGATGETPEQVKNYKAPKELGDKLLSFNVKYAGDLYKLPAPVSVFVENGWKLVDSNVTVAAKSTEVGFEMTKNNQTLRAYIRNYSKSGQPAENCFVTMIKSSEFDPDLPLALPGGITRDSTYDQMIKALGQPDDTDQTSTFKYYTYGEYGKSVTIIFNDETKKISTIEVENSPKELN